MTFYIKDNHFQYQVMFLDFSQVVTSFQKFIQKIKVEK